MDVQSTEREAQVSRRIDEISAIARARMDAADPSIRALRPTEFDWMDSAEHEEMNRLQLEWSLLQPTQAELRRRVAEKRAARIADMKVSA